MKRLFCIVRGSSGLSGLNGSLSNIGYVQASQMGRTLYHILNDGEVVEVHTWTKIRCRETAWVMAADIVGEDECGQETLRKHVDMRINTHAEFSSINEELDQLLFIQQLIEKSEAENIMLIIDDPPSQLMRFFLLNGTQHDMYYGQGVLITEEETIKIPLKTRVPLPPPR